MAAPKQSGHMNTTDQVAPPSGAASQSDSMSRTAAHPAQFSGRSALPLLDSVAYDPCPSRWSRVLSRAVPASLALLGALALGSAGGVLGPADHSAVPLHQRAGREVESGSNMSWTELARVARMQLVAADSVYAPQVMTGAASDLSPDGSERGDSRSERMKARREAAEARRAAAKERREAAKQARLEARQARLEARKARSSGRNDDDEGEEDDDSERGSSASESRAARREAYAQRRAAAKEKREAAAAARREALEERRSAYAERKASAKEKREAAAEARHAALQERREAAKERREEALAARREAAEERREARRAAKEERLAAREGRSSRREASSTVSSSGSFGGTETAMAPAGGAALLRINSRPWAQVYVDGRLVGNTPQLGLQLPPGEHNVRLVNGVFAMGKVLNVKLRAGERVTRVEMLEE